MNLLLVSIALLWAVVNVCESQLMSTCDRITQHGYPCENYTLTTVDGYRLTMFRIPYSKRDIWILSGPNDALPYLLADEGYDVWLGNARGNVYSESHVKLSPAMQTFWEFSLDEIGQIDVPAKIDFILKETNSQSLHYVGYSQGTAVFMIFISSKPEYSAKLKSTHLLAPAIYLCHMQSSFPLLVSPFLGRPNELSSLYGTLPVYELYALMRSIVPAICKQYESGCVNILNLVGGWDSPYLNRTLLPDLLSTVPAGGSNRQFNHFMQSIMSCGLRAYNYGYQQNKLKYGTSRPPEYNLKNIAVQRPMDVYYSDNDFFVSLQDVHDLSKVLGNKVSWHHLKYSGFNHFDYVLAKNVKIAVNNCVVKRMQNYEGRTYYGGPCTAFRNKRN